MPRISLRAYTREIEEMIDNGQNAEAIAHTRYILEQFPKHVDSYRLMGKALLESQRLSDASDVFQRVLSCIPDDFIAHLGMSIIREDEGDLETAIWHMERAFEVQPSNAAVQAELRRLYGSRDGSSPSKIQLTRGALARMSAKSNLNSQAITELRAALADDPGRPDLQVVLARLYTVTGQNMAAIETCNAVLSKLPYCLEANRLLAEILPGTERAKEAQTYRQRYEELDPYASQISSGALSTEQIPDGTITLERLIFSVTDELPPDTTKPGWAKSLGVSPKDEEEMPAWLSGVSEEATPPWAEKSRDPEYRSEPGSEDEGREVTGETSGSDDTPDWLKQIDQEIEPASPEEAPSGALPDWLQASATAEEEGATGPVEVEEFLPEEKGAEADLDTEQPEEENMIIPEDSLEEGSPEENGEQEPTTDSLPTPESEQEFTPENEVPDWLTAVGDPGAIDQSEEVPDWLQDLGEGLPTVEPSDEEPDTKVESEQPISENVDEGKSTEFSSEGPGSLPEWLAEASSEHETQPPDQIQEGSEVVETPGGEDIARAEVPDWLRKMEEEFLNGTSESKEESYATSAIEYMPGEKPISSAEIPPWLVAAMESEESEISAELGEDKPIEDQLIEGDTQPVRISTSETESAVSDAQESKVVPTPPDKEREMMDYEIEEGLEAIPEEGEEPEAEELSAELPPMSVEDESAALAWLENLAARQGALEEELLTEPEERTSEMPEWVHIDAGEEGAPELDEEASIPKPEVIEEPEPSLLEETKEEFAEAPPESPDWLLSKPEEELEAVSPFKEEPSEWVPEEEGEEARFEAPLTEVEADSDQELPTWLRDLDQEEEVEEGVEERVETTPSWLRPEPEVEGEEIPELLTTKLDINTASLIQLERISGIGFILAQNIVNYRETQKTFESLSELEKVPGFSPDSVQELEGYLTVEAVTEAPPQPSTLPELQAAWDKVSTGDIPTAVEEYSVLIRQEQHLEDIIRDLQEAVALHPIDAALYQTLGDAYVRTNRLQEALDAYNRAEDLLH